MKKRILSGTLALAIVIALLASISIPVFAGYSTGIYIGGHELENNGTYDKNSTGFENIITSGTITKNGWNITLDNVTINSSDDGLSLYTDDSSATIELIGKNTITATNSLGIDLGGYGEPTTEISIKSKNESGSQGILEVNGGIYLDEGNLSINDCIVTSNDNKDGIQAYGNLTITNSTVTAAATTVSNDSYGLRVNQGSFTITNSNVNATGGYGVLALMGDINIQSGKLTAKAIFEYGAAVIAGKAENQTVGGNINLGTGMFIKTGGKLCNVVDAGEFIVNTIAEGTVTYENPGKFPGAAKDVVICGPGTVSVQSPQKPSNISSVTLPSQTDLQNAVLTDSDKAAIANGTNVNIQMVINSVQAPSDADKVQQSLGKNTLGMYLDISILKTVGDTQTTVHNLNAPIRITFTIPDNLKGKSKYYVIRVHDGVTTVLEDLDNDPNTITFETNQFSTYALVYSAKSARTSDNSNIVALAVMAASSLAAVAFIEKKKVK